MNVTVDYKYSLLYRWIMSALMFFFFHSLSGYNNQIKAFMADVKSMMSGRSQEGKKGGFGGGALTGSTMVC